jgi:hypothetical protein
MNLTMMLRMRNPLSDLPYNPAADANRPRRPSSSRNAVSFSSARAIKRFPMPQYASTTQKVERGVELISDMLPFGRLSYAGPNAVANAIGYAKHRSRSHHAVIRVYDDAGNVIETHEHKGDFKEP